MLQNGFLMANLLELFYSEDLRNIKKEITYLFCHLSYYTNKKEALVLLGSPNVL